MIASIVFFASLLGIICMIVFKARRLRLDTRSHFSFVSAKVDGRIRTSFARVRTLVSYFNRKSAVALVQWFAYHMLALVRKLYVWLHDKAHAHPRSRKVIDMVQGKGEVNKMGGASFYLKRIAPEESPQSK